MHNLFTYGSLMCNDIMSTVAACQNSTCQATLNDFFRSKIREEEYPGIVPQPGSVVDGVLYLDLCDDAIKRLDVFEGELYQRQEVTVITEEGSTVAAMTYVIKPRYRELLTDQQWSFTEFLAVGKKRFEKSYFGFGDL
ncbi:MAG: gamma-glutamylcyclotransferase family protein [Desulforhopalus sp.]